MAGDHDGATGMGRASLAALTGCNVETVRHYEKVGLMPPPPRTAKGWRVYDARHERRLRFVLRARGLGFSTEEIRGLLALTDSGAQTCAEVKSRAERHLIDVRARIADLSRVEAALDATLAACTGDAAPTCAVLDALGGARDVL